MKKQVQHFNYLILLFIVNAISMILELIAARILSPYLGSSNTVWTIIISMILFANGLGNYYGGKLSEKYPILNLNVLILLLSALSTSIIMLLDKYFIQVYTIKEFTVSNLEISTIVILLFMIPSTLIGMVSPILNKVELVGENVHIGRKSGIIYLLITTGSLAGTLVGGLYLIPTFGCSHILLIISYILVLFAIYLIITDANFIKTKQAVNIICYILTLTIFSLNIGGYKYINDIYSDLDIVIIDTGESYVRIYNNVYDDEEVRFFTVSGGYSSANYIDDQKRDELVFDYTRAYNRVFEANPNFKDFLMIGGAGYSYPRYLMSHYDDKTIDVVEIDGMITEIAKEYFYLNDFLDEYGENSINLITADGRIYLRDTDKKYDVILNDAFSGGVPARSLATKEAVQIIKDSLNEGGVYATNLIGDFNNFKTKFFRSEIKTISSVFNYVWVKNASNDPAKQSGNYIVIASDTDYNLDSTTYTLNENDIVFTDDYAPVEFFNAQ